MTTLFEIAREQKMFSDRQINAFRLYLKDRALGATLLAHHQETLDALAMPKPDRMGFRVVRSCLEDRRFRFRQALTALADQCMGPTPFLAVNNHPIMEPVWPTI